MRADRKLVHKWERILSKHNLSTEQFRSSGLQQLGRNANAESGMAFDPDLEPRNTWKSPAQRRGYTMNDFQGISRVPVRYAPRQCPEWAFDNRACRALLEARYPRIHKPESRDRRDGARAAMILYCAYRLLWSDEQIGWELGVQRQTVAITLWLLKGFAEKLFSNEWEVRGKNRSGHPLFEKKGAGHSRRGFHICYGPAPIPDALSAKRCAGNL